MKGAPVSEQFDDVYFSVDDGLAETRHVFLQGNALPVAWQGVADFTIAETGFGTGLNFLAAWALFEETADADARLHYISFEKYPLQIGEIKEALYNFSDELGAGRIDDFLKIYPPLVPGVHRIVIRGRIFLTLIFDDVNEAMPQVEADVDCWFLDGFTPAKNPEMWSAVVFDNMARLSKQGASLATFTAAGDVRRGLSAVGFEVEKADGFGRKRDMVIGRYKNAGRGQKKTSPRVAIIGGGLAGSACAYVLKRYGLAVTIYERNEGLASEASGNPAGLYNPRFSALKDAVSDFYTSAFVQALSVFEREKDIEYQACGALHLINDEDKEKRFIHMCSNWEWPDDELRIVDASEASEIAGIEVKQNALYLKRSGSVSPVKLCRAYADGVDVEGGCTIENLDDIDADVIVLACGAGVKTFVPWMPLYTVRGQVSLLESTAITQALKCNIHYNGYITTAREGRHMCGATFDRELMHCDVLEEDHAENIKKLKDNLSVFAEERFNIHDGRAGLRTSSQDYFPIVGAVPGRKNLYVSTAHGSHGIVSTLASAHLIADMIAGQACSQSLDTIKALSAQRFIDRAQRRGDVLKGF